MLLLFISVPFSVSSATTKILGAVVKLTTSMFKKIFKKKRNLMVHQQSFVEKSCGIPPSGIHSTPAYTNTLFLDVTVYTCDGGHIDRQRYDVSNIIVSSTKSYACSQNAEWNGAPLNCDRKHVHHWCRIFKK